MRKRTRILLHILLLALLSAALLPTAAAAAETDEPYAPVPYTLYPAPENAYVGDTMPFVTEDGTLEIYYLYDTDRNGQGYHPIYKYSTKDLCGYEDHGMALDFGKMADPDPALGTGSVMQDRDGLYHLFYTGHNDNGNNGKGKECVMHAISTDRKTWTKLPEDTFFAPDNYSKDDFRDPEVFWVEEEQCYWLLIGARDNSLGGVIARYTSSDLKNWEFCGALYAPIKQFMLECPDLFSIGDKWYLTYSWDNVTYYAVGDSMYGPFTEPGDNVLDGNGFIFYAAKCAAFEGKNYLCGWLGRAGLSVDSGIYQWAGNVLNHQLVQNADGTLGVKAPENFALYFTQDKPFGIEPKAGEVEIDGSSVSLSAEPGEQALADLGMRAPTMILTCDVTLDEGGCAGFAFGGSDADSAYTALCLDAKRKMIHYEGYELTELSEYRPEAYTRFKFKPGETHHVTLVCENEIVILYVDELKALSSRIGHSIDGAHIGVFSDGCGASFTNITMKVPA